MRDKPIPAKIILILKSTNDKGYDFIGLSGTLYRQNLIYSEPRELRLIKNTLELGVIFQDKSSFKNWRKNGQIVAHWADKFDNQLMKKPRTIKEKDLLIEVDNVFNCNCGKTDYYFLQGRDILPYNELTCNNCLGQIPYSQIPLDIKIENWQLHYQRVYLNWLESSIFEQQAISELTDYRKGKLNLLGEKIREQLSIYFKIPVYINYFVEEPDDNHPCLVCGQHGTESGLKNPSKICKTCNTIFGYGDN